MSEKQQIIDRMIEISQVAADNSDGKLRLAFNEKDETTDVDKTGHFFKLDEKRVCRDFELYSFDSEVLGQVLALIEFAKLMSGFKKVGFHKLWEAIRHDCANMSEFLYDEHISQYRDLYSIPSPKKSTDK